MEIIKKIHDFHENHDRISIFFCDVKQISFSKN